MASYGYSAVHPCFRAAEYSSHYVDIVASLIHDCLLAAEYIHVHNEPASLFLLRGMLLSMAITSYDLASVQDEDGVSILCDLANFRLTLLDANSELNHDQVRRDFHILIRRMIPRDRSTRPWYWQGSLVDPTAFLAIIRGIESQLSTNHLESASPVLEQYRESIRDYFRGSPRQVPTIRLSSNEGIGRVREDHIFLDILRGTQMLFSGARHGMMLSQMVSLQQDNIATIYSRSSPLDLIVIRDVICGIMPGPSILTVSTAVTWFLPNALNDLTNGIFRRQSDLDLADMYLQIIRNVTTHPMRAERELRSLIQAVEDIVAGYNPLTSSIPSTSTPTRRSRRLQASPRNFPPEEGSPIEQVHLHPTPALFTPPPTSEPTLFIPHPQAAPVMPNDSVFPGPAPVTQSPTDIVRQINPAIFSGGTCWSELWWDIIYDPQTARTVNTGPFGQFRVPLDLNADAFDFSWNVRKVHFITNIPQINYWMEGGHWGPLILEEKGPISIKAVTEKVHEYFKTPLTGAEMERLTSLHGAYAMSHLSASQRARNRDANGYQPPGGSKYLRSDLLAVMRRVKGFSVVFDLRARIWKVSIDFAEGPVPDWWRQERYQS